MRFWPKAFPYILIFALSFFSWKALLAPGYFSMHDDQQVVRLQQLDEALRAGQFPVRWVKDLGFGFGYPLFNFYPPLVYYLGEVFVLAGLGYITSVKIVWFLALVGSAAAMYVLAKRLWGRTGGLVASLFYLFAPYHAVDAYARGALAELFSFVWLPLILYTSYGAHRHFLFSGFFLALLMLTHNLIFLPFVGFYILWCGLLTLAHRETIVRSVTHCLLSLAWCFALSAFFWLPSLAEKKYTLVDQLLTTNLASYRIHFVCPAQLWASLWGYGGSVAGCLDGMTFRVGKLHLIFSLAALALFLICRKWKSRFLHNSCLVPVIFLLLFVSLFMTTEYSRFFWDITFPLWYLQFPWRFLVFAALFSSLLAGAVFSFFRARLKIVPALLLIAAVIFLEGKYFRPQKFFPGAQDETLTTEKAIKWDVSSTSFEYLPRGFAMKTNEKGLPWADISKSQISNLKSQIRQGDFVAREEEFLPGRFILRGETKTGAEIQFSVVNFPGWKVWTDGKEAAISDGNKYKLITVNVPAGTREIAGQFTNTPVRVLGNALSLISIVSFLGWGSIEWRNRCRNRSHFGNS